MLLLLVLWLIIYAFAQLFRYVVAPVWLLFYYHVIFRAWNYLAVETPQEWIYIHYHSKDKPNFNRLYLRLCDKIKRNRMILLHAKYPGLIRRTKGATLRLMIICGIVSTLWVSSFGLHQEYAMPAMVVNVDLPMDTPSDDYNNSPAHTYDASLAGISYEETSVPSNTAQLGWLNPAAWPIDTEIILYLTELGAQGTRLRNGPGIAGYSVIEILWDNDQMVYLHLFYSDPDVAGLYWLHVLSPSGTEGYVSSQLVSIVES